MKEIDRVMHAVNTWSQSCAIATVVKTKGSSYRKPGAVMLIGKDGSAIGAVSGGCIEKEIIRRSQSVFASSQPLLVVYDGRYVFGCNGTLFILIEPFDPVNRPALASSYASAFESRLEWDIVTTYEGDDLGSVFVFADKEAYTLRRRNNPDRIIDEAKHQLKCFKKSQSQQAGKFCLRVKPSRKLYIIGYELDAMKLASMACELGYMVNLVTHPQNPGVTDSEFGFKVEITAPELLGNSISPDDETVVVLMTHSYSRDLGYLKALLHQEYIPYLGLVGPKQRTDDLLSDIIEQGTPIPAWLDASLRAPVGLDLGGENPAEIAISILAEIETVFSGHSGKALSEKNGGIHSKI